MTRTTTAQTAALDARFAAYQAEKAARPAPKTDRSPAELLAEIAAIIRDGQG